MSRTYGSITIVDTTDIESIVIEYAQNQDSANAPAESYPGWSTDRPTWKQGYFVWQRTRIHKAGTTADKDELGTAVCITGSTGSTGGAGRSLTGTQTKYTNVALNTTETQVKALAESNWGTNVPAYNASKPDYWVRIKNTYSSGTTVQYIYYKDNGLTSAVSTAAAANTTANQANQTANQANTTAGEAQQLAEQANEMVGRYTILWNYSSFNTSDNGQAYICAYDPITGVKSDANGWVKWNNTKRTITKQMVNPNTIAPYNVPIYVVCRLSSSTATTGTNHMVWYNSKWQSAPCPTATASNVVDWTWADATDIVLGKFVEPSSQGAFSECEIYNPPWSAKQVTSNTVTANAALASANGKNKVVYGSNNPGTSGYINGDTWFKYGTGDDAANIIGVYKFSGSSWVEQPLTSETFAYIDAGKITAGNIAAARLQAGVISAVNSSTETSGGSSLKISAEKVNIEGAAIFSGSGRLSETSLNNAYDENGAAATAQTTAINTAAADATSKANAAKTQAINAAAADAQEKIDSIEIGGRNLFGYGSECKSLNGFTLSGTWDIVTEDGFVCAHTSGALKTTKNLQSKIPFIPKPKETVTFSGYVKIKNIVYGTTNPMCEFYIGGETIDGAWRSASIDAIYVDGQKISATNINSVRFPSYITDTNWHHFAIVRTWQNYTFTANMSPWVYLRDSTGDLYVRNLKYERGNKATDWSPAPQDVDASIAAVSTVANAAAPKSSAVAKTQRIYYRSSSSTKPTGYPTAWVTDETNKWNSNATTTTGWSRRATPISNGKGENVTKYLYLWTATQKQMVNGTVVTLTANDIALDDSTTVIDGGNIITGTVTANQLNASSINVGGFLTIGALTTDTQALVNNDNIQIGGRNLFRETALLGKTTLPNNTSDLTFTKDFVRLYNNPSAYSFTKFNENINQIEITLNNASNLGIAFIRLASEIDLDSSSYYTISCWAKCTKITTLAIGLTYYNTADKWVYRGGTNAQSFSAVNTWQKFTLSFKPDADTKGICYCFTSNGGVSGGTDKLYIRQCKLEKGNKATDWSPAPQDVDSAIINAVDSIEVGSKNLSLYYTARITPTQYDALDTYLTEPLQSGQTYVLQLWNIDVAHSGKAAADLGVDIYYCGGSIRLGGWHGTNYFTNGHADYLSLTFTPYDDKVTASIGGNMPGGQNLSHASVAQAVEKYLRFYNSVGNVDGTRNLTVERWKLEKGNTPTDWTPSPEDAQEEAEKTQREASETLTANMTDLQNNLQSQINTIKGGSSSSISQVIQQIANNSLIKLGKAAIDTTQNLILRQSENSTTYMQLAPTALILVANGTPVATIANNNSIGEFIANNCQISTLKMRSEGGRQGQLAWIARENGHLSLKQITD